MATEKSYYAKINAYYIKNIKEYGNNIVWEAKFTRTRRIAFNSLANHQEASLLQAERYFSHKLADVGIALKPFDGFILYKATVFFIAIYFSKNKTEIYEIPIRSLLREKYTSGNKSLTKERAKEIGRLIHI